MASKIIGKTKFRIYKKIFWYLTFIPFFIFSCDQSFEPLQENDKYYFSMYGYLDAAADTQWVRVSLSRQDINELPDPTGIQVTLEHIQSGEKVIMNDSLFTSRGALNYWTTYKIENEQTYRIVTEREDGKSSSVVVTIPKEMQIPRAEATSNPQGFNIYIDDDVEHLADVQTKWYAIVDPEGTNQKRIFTFSYRNTAKWVGAYDGSYYVLVNIEEEEKSIRESNPGGNIIFLKRQVFVAAGGPEWDEKIPGIDDSEYFLNDVASNVENGLGYVVGIDSKWIPYQMCLSEQFVVIPCPEEEPFWK